MGKGIILTNSNIQRRFNWVVGSYLLVSPFVAAFGLYVWLSSGSFNWATITLLMVIMTFAQVSITAGYHRLFAHRAYQAKWPVRLFFLLFGAAAFEGSALQWSLDHRNHHNYVDDKDKDPYAITRGFFWAHMGWLLFKQDEQLEEVNKAGDLLDDPLVTWQYRYWIGLGIFFGFVLPGLIAWIWGDMWGGVFIVGFLRSVINHHATFLINSLSHCVGKQTYSDTHSARDNLFTALLTFGEGYHNYHHEFASDYRNGPRWYDWDPSKWIIKALSLVGLTYNLKTIREEIIVRKRMQMTEKRMRRRLEGSNFNFFGSQDFKILEQLKDRMEATFKDLSKLRDQYQTLAKAIKLQDQGFSKLELNVLNDRINQAREQFMRYVSEWNTMQRRVLAYAAA